MTKRSKILLAAAEFTPLAKVGGLGDVIGALPKALLKLNLDVRVIIPFYGLINRYDYKFKLIKSDILVTTKLKVERVNLWRTIVSGITVYLIEHDFYKTNDIYSSKLDKAVKLYPNDLIDIEKFVFFSHALLESVKAIGFKPDIIHLNDWHTAAVTLFLKTAYRKDRFYQKVKTLLTIHNLANQGITDPKIIELNQINPSLASVMIDLKDNDINFLAQGIINADLINTVSPTYAKEILTVKYGTRLKKILLKRKNDLFGILNGIDVNYFNPQTDRLIRQKYSINKLNLKIRNKTFLQKKLNLPQNEKVVLVGLVSRLVWQKGLDLITKKLVGAIPSNSAGRHELPLPCQFIFLGTGNAKYENQLKQLAKKYPKKISAQIKFDEPLAHQIYAGADIFLMPSRFEPCGLGQMIAMRYGTVPIVHATGGLKDTVLNFQIPRPPCFATRSGQANPKSQITALRDPATIKINIRSGTNSPPEADPPSAEKSKIQNSQANGFCFEELSGDVLLKTLQKALLIYYNQPDVWRQLQINGMKKDFSWDKSAKEYSNLYKKLLK